MKVYLRDGVLHDEEGYVIYQDANYFYSVEDAKRWLAENKIDAEVIEDW